MSWPDISQSVSLSDSKPKCLYRQWCQLVLSQSVNNVRPNAHELGAGLSYNNNRENVCQKNNKTYTPKGGHSGQLASALFDLLRTSFFMKKWWHLLFFLLRISSCTTQVISFWVKILSFHPEDCFSKVSVTFRAQNQIFKSKYREKDCKSWLRLQVVPIFHQG